MRIQEHPILGTYEKGQLVSFTFDGKTLEGYAGEPIAMALKNAGVMVHRYTRKEHKPRGIFCAHSAVPTVLWSSTDSRMCGRASRRWKRAWRSGHSMV